MGVTTAALQDATEELFVKNMKDLDQKVSQVETSKDIIRTEDGKVFTNQEAKDTYDRIVEGIKKSEDRKKHPVGSGIKKAKKVVARKAERQNKKNGRK